MKKSLCILLCLALLIFVCACSPTSSQKNTDGDIKSQTLPSVYELYYTNSEEQAFLLVEFESFGSIVTSQIDKTADEYLLVNFKIIESFNKLIACEKIVTVPFALETVNDYATEIFTIIDIYNNSFIKSVNCEYPVDSTENGNSINLTISGSDKKYYSVEDVKELILSTKQFVLYLDFMLNSTNNTELFTTTKGLAIAPITEEIHFNTKAIFLVDANNNVSQDKLQEMASKYDVYLDDYKSILYDYEDFFYEGISLNCFKENINKIKTKQQNNLNNSTEGEKL